MIPIRDRLAIRRRPVMTWALIALNVLAFLYEREAAASGYARLVLDWGFVPVRFLRDPAGEIVTVLTAMFLHAGWLHLGGNMLFLWIFGDDIEDRLGRLSYLCFYLLSGLVAAGAQLAIDPTSPVPMVGASGAIAGVLGAYILLFPRARVVVAFPIFVFLQLFEWPAWFVIGEWFVLQLLQGLWSLSQPGSSYGVAFFAHIGGFLAGLLLVRVFPALPEGGGAPFRLALRASGPG